MGAEWNRSPSGGKLSPVWGTQSAGNCSEPASGTSPTGSGRFALTLFLSWPLQERGFPIIVEELDWALRTDVEPVEFPTVLMARQSRSARLGVHI